MLPGDGPAGGRPGDRRSAPAHSRAGRPASSGELIREGRVLGRGLEATGDRGSESAAGGRAPHAGWGARVSVWRTWYLSGTLDTTLGPSERAPLSSEIWNSVAWVTSRGPAARSPSLTVALVLEWKVIVCEVGGAGVLLRQKTPPVTPAVLFF